MMSFQKEHLDLVLVPSGLLIMFAYHLFLLYRCLNLPHTTVIGFENNDKKAWVERIMQIDKKDLNPVIIVISSNTSAATVLASISLILCSLIGAWIANNSTIFQSELIYGDTRPSTMAIKYISLLICFLLAFSCFVQSSRYFIHTNYLISTPDSDVPIKSIESTIIRAGDFWSLGLRALYLATTLLLWLFGPIPMFATSVSMVLLLHFLDTNTTPLHRHNSHKKKPLGRVRGTNNYGSHGCGVTCEVKH
ncbi:unnamed protein product [Ilex paraguariensis]|uniref:Uncharacterized protein n=1 Tax=Ilex paraguariensis TaxID=185542 RepID=A0ABC8ULK0_9AQUA